MECAYDCYCELCNMEMDDIVNDWLNSDDD